MKSKGYAVVPQPEKFGIPMQVPQEVLALFQLKHHAVAFGDSMWPDAYNIIEVTDISFHTVPTKPKSITLYFYQINGELKISRNRWPRENINLVAIKEITL